jgi:hypothetical protein
LILLMGRASIRKTTSADKEGSLLRRRLGAVAALASVLFALSGVAALTATAGPPVSSPQAGAAKNCDVTALVRKRDSLEGQLKHNPSAKRTSELEPQIKALDAEITKIKAACKKPKKHSAKKCHRTSCTKKKTTPPPTPPPAQTSCSGTVTDGPEGDEDIDDPCANAPGQITKFTVAANKGQVTNSMPPPGFACNVPPAQSDGTMTCTAATPVDASTKIHFAIQVAGGTGRCPGLTLTVTDTFTSGTPVTFKVSC